MVGVISVAYESQADKQLSGVFSLLQLPLNKLYTKELFWLLSSHQEDEGHLYLAIRAPVNPMFLAVGTDPRLNTSFLLIIALLATVCNSI